MNTRKNKQLLIVTNALGLVLCIIDTVETRYMLPVTRLEQEYINWVECNYDRLIDCVIEEEAI